MGENVVWIITVKNNGIINATNVKVTDKLPKGLKYINHTAGKGTFDPESGIWSIDNLGVNETQTLNITTETLKTGKFTNTVSVTSDTEDNNLTNNEGNFTIEATQETTNYTNKTYPPVVDDNETDDIPDPTFKTQKEDDADSSANVKSKVDRNATGNPVLLILLALLSVLIVGRRKI